MLSVSLYVPLGKPDAFAVSCSAPSVVPLVAPSVSHAPCFVAVQFSALAPVDWIVTTYGVLVVPVSVVRYTTDGLTTMPGVYVGGPPTPSARSLAKPSK